MQIDKDTVSGVMPFRTPRRRISPRTKRRVRAIKNFFKKTIGTISQTDCRTTTSSIIISVSDLKSKIDIIEQQLDKVSKHCRDLTCLESSFKRADSGLTQNDRPSSNDGTEAKHLRGVETRIIYKTPKNDYSKSDESEYVTKYISNNSKKTIESKPIPSNSLHQENQSRRRDTYNKHSKRSERREIHNTTMNRSPDRYEMRRASSSANLYSRKDRDHRNDPGCSAYRRSERKQDAIRNEKSTYGRQDKLRNEFQDTQSEHQRSRKKKHKKDLDEEFIADIIRRQYKPVKLFGRRFSDFSQFSEPICRDQEFSPRIDIEEGSELCSCCYEGQRRVSHRYCHKNDLSDMRSICDARLYSSKRNRRYKHATNNYNDSNVYDLIPVKEKTSPKSRRKFIEESMVPYQCYKEVPPSPRTHRPRLNLKAQHYDYEDSIAPKYRQRNSPTRAKKHHDLADVSENSSENSERIKRHNLLIKSPSKPNNLQETSLEYSAACNDQINLTNNDTLLTHGTGSTANKADQALNEIKDILQSFLQEIKKESTSSNHSQIDSKSSKPQAPHAQEDQKNTSTQMSMPNFNTMCGMGQSSVPPFMSPFPNPCCYPILPICPINCTPNGYIVPSPSYTCTNCANNSNETSCHNNKANSNHNHPHSYDETQELIKEIYKFVAQSPNTPSTKPMNQVHRHQATVEKKILTSRSVGSSNASKRDVMVETPTMKCFSKSCEAIGSRLTSGTCYSTTNPSYSDTVLEKLSLEVSDSTSESELDTESTEKNKKHKFSKVLRKFGLFKRKKKDVIEEVSESESTEAVEVQDQKQKSKSPFQQHIMDYSVHRQEYFHPPPIADPRICHAHQIPHRHACGDDCYAPRTSYDSCKHRPHPHDHSTPHCYHSSPRATTSWCKHDYDPRYHTLPPQAPPQVPLCLKEIEVKSTGTQSERKMSIFKHFKKKGHPQTQVLMMPQKHQNYPKQTAKEKNPLFNWKALQEKAKLASSNSDPMKFSLKTQKQLAEGDMKLRNAMLKKLFYKRNPFSPRNLIVRTLLGKDKSSFGEPPKLYRPRMFL